MKKNGEKKKKKIKKREKKEALWRLWAVCESGVDEAKEKCPFWSEEQGEYL